MALILPGNRKCLCKYSVDAYNRKLMVMQAQVALSESRFPADGGGAFHFPVSFRKMNHSWFLCKVSSESRSNGRKQTSTDLMDAFWGFQGLFRADYSLQLNADDRMAKKSSRCEKTEPSLCSNINMQALKETVKWLLSLTPRISLSLSQWLITLPWNSVLLGLP